MMVMGHFEIYFLQSLIWNVAPSEHLVLQAFRGFHVRSDDLENIQSFGCRNGYEVLDSCPKFCNSVKEGFQLQRGIRRYRGRLFQLRFERQVVFCWFLP